MVIKTEPPPHEHSQDSELTHTAPSGGLRVGIFVQGGVSAPNFVRFRKVLAQGFSSHSRWAFARHPVGLGECALDVGCGSGETSLELGALVGETGNVLGVDSAEPLIELARLDAAKAKARHVRFDVVDSETHSFEPTFDVCFARFGTMSFQSPVAAMRNLRGAVRRGGRLIILVWRTLDDNDWVRLTKEVALRHLPPPPGDEHSSGPGPFSMADRGTVRQILETAGWSSVAFERVDAPVLVGESASEAAEFHLQLGPAGDVIRGAGAAADAKRAIITAELTELLESYAKPSGIVMSSSSWCVTARS